MSTKNVSDLCLRCKGSRYLCGKPSCPLLLKARALAPVRAQIQRKQDLDGLSPPSFFVGHKNYPKVFLGPMVPVIQNDFADIPLLDTPERWFGHSIEEIVQYRASLVRTMTPISVYDAETNSSRIVELSQELIMARRPTAIEALLEKPVNFKLSFANNNEQPMGPTGKLTRLSLQENPAVEVVVEKVVSDGDLLATDAITTLFQENIPTSQIVKILSAGLLGVSKQRKLVPTRWSITAVDDSAGKQLLERIRYYPPISENVLLFQSNYLDNWFYILMMPKPWAFEVLEAWLPQSSWNPLPGEQAKFAQDYEWFTGRTSYASNVAGGYYAARLAVLEYLEKIKRSAAVLICREIRAGYFVPLGVWQVRENMRNAMKSPPQSFNSLPEAVKTLDGKLIIPIREWTRKSALLQFIRNKTLFDYFKRA